MIIYRFLSIDPGTSHMGMTVHGIDENHQWVVLHSHSVDIVSLTNHLYPESFIDHHGKRFAQMLTIQRVLRKMIEDWGVQTVVSESPYMGRFAQAFAALTECLLSMRYIIYEINPNLKFYTIDPATIKKAVGVSGKSGDKNLMKIAANNLVGHYYDIQFLDEHAIDSICIGNAWYHAVYCGGES